MKTKVIVVTGGVFSSLGKGIIASSIGRILTELKYSVSMLKCDPYLNIDPGTLSPYQHGEVFVTDDGYETDLDLGYYERFTGANVTKLSSLTAGKVYFDILNRERNGDFNGKTVQVIPHITNEIKSRFYDIINKTKSDFLIIEIGGTVGDIESIPFIESLSQFSNDYGENNVLFIHCTPLININSAGEIKTKPTQHSIRELSSLGIMPKVIVLRTDQKIDKDIIEKISINCHIPQQNIFISSDISNIYYLPISLYKQGIHKIIFKYFNISSNKGNLNNWILFNKKISSLKKKVKIAIVGKYVKLHDAYKSIFESLKLAGYELNYDVEIGWINSELINSKNVKKVLKKYKGILIPGGFGTRGISGMIETIKYARKNNVPLFGICLGMQLICIEYARNVLKHKDANSMEFNNKTSYPIFKLLNGEMRLGSKECYVVPNTLAFKIFNKKTIFERHRHRYCFNDSLIEEFSNNGLIFSSFSNDKDKIVEIVELQKNIFFIGCQFHPEFSSKPQNVEPLFIAFIKAVAKKQYKK